jgi:signal transduction histidine kinase/streptogramin lyase
MWVHATNEWQKFDPKTESFLRQPMERDSYPLFDDREGNLWVGKYSGGLYKRDHLGRTTRFHDSAGLEFRQAAFCLIETRDGHFWMGTSDGVLFAVDPDRHSVRRIQEAGSDIETIFEDSYGLLWIGTWNDGLLCYDPGKETAVRYRYDPGNPASLSSDVVCTLHEDKTGTLWVGAIGLNRFDRAAGTFTHFTVRDGLPGDVVVKILEDDRGNLWLGTNKGISKFDPKTMRFKNYDVSYGLASNSSRMRSGCRTTNGEMYFGGKGLTRFHPDSIRDNPYVPPIVVTQFRLFERPTPLSNEINLSYQENAISFEFAALSYISPEKNRYAYKMEGIDTGWVQSGTRRYAGYPHLDPGEYVFRVKGSNNDGVWNEVGTSILVRIVPPFWARWWFRSFAVITMFLAIGGGIRYVEMRKLKRRIERLEQERALERERLRISQDMHDEVGSALSEITILTELVKKEFDNSHNAQAHIHKISDRSREVTKSIAQIVWAINPKNDPLENLVAYIRHYAVQYFTASPIRCHCNFPETVPEVHLSAEARRNVFLAVKESLHNIVKHSSATEAVITLRHTGTSIEILVEDNGKGFSPEARADFGNGLENMTRRLAQIKGFCEVQSSPGAGTRVRIVFGGS